MVPRDDVPSEDLPIVTGEAVQEDADAEVSAHRADGVLALQQLPSRKTETPGVAMSGGSCGTASCF